MLEITAARGQRVPRAALAAWWRRACLFLRLRPATHLEVALVSDHTMRALNRRTRGVARVTDVLSFPLHSRARVRRGIPRDPDGARRLGGLVIALPTARRQARGRGVAVTDEVIFLASHGLLHLLGYDHRSPRERKTMGRLTRQLIAC